jgi:hypothetical protein
VGMRNRLQRSETAPCGPLGPCVPFRALHAVGASQALGTGGTALSRYRRGPGQALQARVARVWNGPEWPGRCASMGRTRTPCCAARVSNLIQTRVGHSAKSREVCFRSTLHRATCPGVAESPSLVEESIHMNRKNFLVALMAAVASSRRPCS